MNTEPIIIERVFHVSPARIWKAITDKNEMKQWYFDLEEFKPEPGFEFRFEGGPSPEKQYLHICVVQEVIENRKISYSWRYEEYPGVSLVTFELFEEGENTRLRLTHGGLEIFPLDNPDLARENFEAGWNQIIGTSLKAYLDK